MWFVSLSKTLVLENVLFVSNLNCILLSVAKLLKQTGCLALFTETLCILQERFTRNLIGAGEKRNGVYVYRDITFIKSNRVRASEDQAGFELVRIKHCGIDDGGIQL